MGEVVQEEKAQKGAKRRPKKHPGRIDMTPMVDLMCLLLTFFILTAAFSKPKIMTITMPEKDPNAPAPKIDARRTLNILLTDSDRVYYYVGAIEPGKPQPEIVKSNFSKDGIRKVLLLKNKDLFTKISEFNDKRVKGKIHVSDAAAEDFIKDLKKDDNVGPIILIKADEGARYKDIVSIVDEMAITNIASYAIVDLSAPEKALLKAQPR